MKRIAPREFQSKGITELRKKIAEGKKRIILSSPTGSGKGFVMALLADLGISKNSTVLTILYGKDLIVQTAENYKRYFEIESQIIMGGIKSPPQKSIIASISTLSRRNLPDADFLIIDECHQTNAPEYQKIFEHYKDKIIIGLSATALNNLCHFEDYVILATVQGLIDDDYLVKPRHFIPAKKIDVSKVHVRAGEYVDEELEKEALKITGDIIKEYLERAKGRPGVTFCVNVNHSIELCKAYNEAGIKTVHIDGKTPLEMRSEYLKQLACGDIEMVTNVNVFSTGIDCPIISYVGMARPTKSEILYVQQGGRGLRTAENKSDCMVLDFAGNALRFGLLTDEREPNIKPVDKSQKKNTDEREVKLWVCVYCYACNPSNETVCCDCGKEKPVVIREIKAEDGELIEISEMKRKKKDVVIRMPFGQYKGKQLIDLPMNYLSRIINSLNSSDNEKDKELYNHLKTELKGRMSVR